MALLTRRWACRQSRGLRRRRFLMFLMWAIMMVAMMLPSAAPMVLTYAAVVTRKADLGRRICSRIPARVARLRMGVRHGGYCVGCCWALMLLLFVGGLMNLLWVAAISAFVLVEKLIFQGTRLVR